MTGSLKPNRSLSGASSSAVHRLSCPVCRFIRVLARSPGTASWAKKVTDAAATITSTDVTALTAIRRARATRCLLMPASSHEVRVGEDRLALALLEPDVLEVLGDGVGGVLRVE